MLVASLLDVVGDQQHVEATSPRRLRHEPQSTPLKFEEPNCPGASPEQKEAHDDKDSADENVDPSPNGGVETVNVALNNHKQFAPDDGRDAEEDLPYSRHDQHCGCEHRNAERPGALRSLTDFGHDYSRLLQPNSSDEEHFARVVGGRHHTFGVIFA